MGAFFTILFFYPFLERRLSGDRRVHNLLDRPSEAPVRTALGFAAITFFLVAWSATWFTTDLSASPPLLTVTEPIFQTILYGLRIAIFVLPAVAFAVALVVCRRRLR